jgi:transposase
MRSIREVLRLYHELARSNREISMATGLSKGSVSEYLRRARDCGLTWEVARELGERELEAQLFKTPGRNEPASRIPIDFEWVHREMKRKGVTLQLLWVEYSEAARHDERGRRPYGYSQFCDLYREFRGRVDVVMRQEHRAGEKCFVDYSGLQPTIVDRETGEVVKVELFVAVLGASGFTFAEATRSQQRDEFIGSMARAFEYFGGVTEITVPDQLKSAVAVSDRFDPDLNPTFAEFGEHFGTAVIPARPRKPRDKAKVESTVQVAQRWLLARVRNVTFFSLEDLNVALAALLEQLNDAPFQKLEGTRRSVYEAVDKPALRPLPVRRFEPSTWKKATVHIDHHVEYDGRYYSVPHALVGSKLWVRATVSAIELLLDGKRVASHGRSYNPKGTYVTVDAHRPKSHRQYGAWPPTRIIAWATELGPRTGALVDAIMRDRPHPEQGYRSCLALIRDAKRYPVERIEAACARALSIGAPTRRSVLAILKNGLDQIPLENDDDDAQLRLPIAHGNVRGSDYYATVAAAAADAPDEPVLQVQPEPEPQPELEDAREEHEDDRRRDPPKTPGDALARDVRCLHRTARGRTEQPTQLQREDRIDGRSRVDGPREQTTHTATPSSQADD